MAVKIQLRRGSAAQWNAANPVLAAGEFGLELDTDKRKIGDGVHAWGDLDYDLTRPVADALYATAEQVGALGTRTDQVDDRIDGLATVYAPTPPWVTGHAYAVGDVVLSPVLRDALRCIQAHTSAAIFTDDLNRWYPVSAPPNEQILTQQFNAAKGGRIGVGDRGVIAIRFDDWHEDFVSTMYPKLLELGLPAGMACISRLSLQPWSDTITGADIAAWNKRGIEIHSHGTNHNDPSPHDLMGTHGLYDQIVNSKAEIEAWGVKCQGWMQPGATPLTAAAPYGGTGAADFFNKYAGWLIRNTYPVSEGDLGAPSNRFLPDGTRHGANHVTISDGLTLATAKSLVDTVVATKTCTEVMIHTGNLGVGSNMTVAEMQQFFDYVAAARDAGQIEVLTPSGALVADHGTARRNLIADPNPASLSLGLGTVAKWGYTGSPAPTIEDESGTSVIEISGTNFVNRTINGCIRNAIAGETWVFEADAKSTSGTTTQRLLLQSYPDSTALNLSLTKANVGTSWTKIRYAFTIPPSVDSILIGIGRNGGGTIRYKNVNIWKV